MISGIDKTLSKINLLAELWLRNLILLGYGREELRDRVIAWFTLSCPWIKGVSHVRWVIEQPKDMMDRLLACKYVTIEWCRSEVKSYVCVSRFYPVTPVRSLL